MGRYLVLAVVAVMLGGCLVEGDKQGTPDPTEDPQRDTVQTFDGRMQRRVVAPVGAVDDAIVDMRAPTTWTPTTGVDSASVELGGKYARSSSN